MELQYKASVSPNQSAEECTRLIRTSGVNELALETRSQALEEASAAVRTYLDEISTEADFPSVSVALSIDGLRRLLSAGRTQRKDGSRPADDDTFEANCVFKPMMAATALELFANGQLDLDASIGQYIPEIADSRNMSIVRVRHLLENTAGYRGFHNFPPLYTDQQRTGAFSRIREATSLFWPGTVFSYENSTTALLAEILGRHCRHQVGRLVRQVLFDPIGVSPELGTAGEHARASGSIAAPSSEVASKNGMRLKISDFLTVAETLAGTNCNESLSAHLSATTLLELHGKKVDIPRSAGSKALSLLPNGASSGLFVFKDGFLGYDGMSRGETLGFRFCPKRKVAIVLGIRQGARDLRRAMLREILDRVTAINRYLDESESQCEKQHATFQHKELSGYYFGNHSCDALVRASPDSIQLIGLNARSKPVFSLSGRFARDGSVSFPSVDASIDPTFFRYQRTGEPCVMIGMTAFKKLPAAQV